ncbi:MAG: ABC transporter ATP-binding protein [Desulfobacterales bacterium]|nr:ABC transporter ATP-binding protein [Desulfobacterales bacterium]
MLEVKDIHTYYGTSHVIFALSLHVAEGELVGLLGRNGAGKTTTLLSIIGVTPPRSGSIKFLGEEMRGKAPYNIARLGMGFVPDNRRIFPDLSVLDNLKIAERKQSGTTLWTVERVFELFPQLRELVKRRGEHLSGGEQQMLAIGRALMGNPQLLLMDEPTSGLSPLLVDALEKQVRRLKEEGVTVLLSEQNAAFTSNLTERTYIIDMGMIRYEGETQDLIENEEIRKKYLMI